MPTVYRGNVVKSCTKGFPSFEPPMSEVTRILSAIDQGDRSAADQLFPLVYDELRKLAAQKLAQEKPGQTLDAHRAGALGLPAFGGQPGVCQSPSLLCWLGERTKGPKELRRNWHSLRCFAPV
jgi:hypothetical protein